MKLNFVQNNAMQFCVEQCDAIVCRTVKCNLHITLHCNLCRTMQCNFVQNNAMQFCAEQCIIINFCAEQCTAILCRLMQCNFVQNNAMQFMQNNAIKFCAEQCNAILSRSMQCSLWRTMQCNFVQNNAMQCNGGVYLVEVAGRRPRVAGSAGKVPLVVR